MPLDVGIGSKPGPISNQNAGTLAIDEHPQAMHISELFKQTKDGRDVVYIRCSQIVVSLANQFFTLISNKLAETVRNFDVPSVAVYRANSCRITLTAGTSSTPTLSLKACPPETAAFRAGKSAASRPLV